jgi:hypothetical protein
VISTIAIGSFSWRIASPRFDLLIVDRRMMCLTSRRIHKADRSSIPPKQAGS